MGQTQFLDFIFATKGQDTSANPKTSAPGVMETCVNCDFDQEGGLTLRPGFSPITMAGRDIFDLYSYGETLIGIGSSGEAYPVDIQVLNNVVAADPWFQMGTDSGDNWLRGSDVEQVGGSPYTSSEIFGFSVAATATLIAQVVSSPDSASGATRTLHISDPITGASVLLETEAVSPSGGNSWVVALGNDFGWVAQNPSTGVVTLRVADVTGPAQAALGSPVVLFSDSNPAVPIIVKSDATRIHVLYRVDASNNVRYRQFTHAGVENGTGKIVFSASATTRFALTFSATQVHTLVKVSSTSLSLLTFGIASPFTTAVGPTAITTPAMDGTNAPGVEILFVTSASEVWLFYTTLVAGLNALVTERRPVATHVLSSTFDTNNFLLQGGSAVVGDQIIVSASHLAWSAGNTEVGLGATAPLRLAVGSSGFNTHPLYYEDRNLAAAPQGGGNLGFNLATVGSTVYIPSAYRQSQDSTVAVVRKVTIDSTARRPGVELGGLLYLAGAQMLVTEGRQLVESGMPPPDLDIPTQGTTGALTQGGEYKYRAHYEWLDWKGNKHISPVSIEQTVTLTGANDSVTWSVQIPPSRRAYGSGDSRSSAPLLKLFRTETNIDTEPAVATGGSVAPGLAGGGTFNFDAVEALAPGVGGGQMVVNIDGAPTSINFSAGSLTLADVVDQLNTQLAGDAVVTTSGSSLVFTTVSEGVGSTISFSGGSIIRAVLGLSGVTAQGTTETNAGEIFFLTATKTLTPQASPDYAEFTTITDTTADADLIDNETLYTTGDRGAVSGVLDFAPPLPATYLTATRDRIVAASPGLVQISQKAFPNEAVAFVDPNLVGPVGFAYQARVDGKITGVAAIDDSIVVGTRDELFVIGGDGPNYVGIGEFSVPARLPSEVGFYDWRSIVLTSEGLWFLGDIDKLYLLPRGGGVPTFAGEPVQRRLGSYISGAAVTEGDTPRVAFAVGDAARAVVRDIKSQQWMEYTLPATPARSFIEHRGKFYFVTSSGDVWQQTAFSDNGSPIVLTTTMNTLAPFGLNRQGRLRVVQYLGEFKTAASVKLEISYDDGTTYVDMGSFSVSGLAADAPVRLQWFPHPQRGDRFKLRWTMTPTTATQGIVMNGFSLGVMPSKGETKLDAARRK